MGLGLLLRGFSGVAGLGGVILGSTGDGRGDKKNSCRAWGVIGILLTVPAFGSVPGLRGESVNMTPKVSV